MELLNLQVVREYGGVFLHGLMITVLLTGDRDRAGGHAGDPDRGGAAGQAAAGALARRLYVEFIRATPLILQLIYIYYVLPGAGIRLEPVHRGRHSASRSTMPPT